MLLRMSSPAFGFALLLPLAAALLHALLSADLVAPTCLSCCAPQVTTELAPGCQQSRCRMEFASYGRSPCMLHTWKERKARQELGEDAGQAPDIDAWPIWQPQ